MPPLMLGDHGGIYRSDDAGESWTRASADGRHWSRGSDFAEVKVHPQNPDIVFSANVVTWKSEMVGKTWKGFVALRAEMYYQSPSGSIP